MTGKRLKAKGFNEVSNRIQNKYYEMEAERPLLSYEPNHVFDPSKSKEWNDEQYKSRVYENTILQMEYMVKEKSLAMEFEADLISAIQGELEDASVLGSTYMTARKIYKNAYVKDHPYGMYGTLNDIEVEFSNTLHM